MNQYSIFSIYLSALVIYYYDRIEKIDKFMAVGIYNKYTFWCILDGAFLGKPYSVYGK
jgi:hypothetical protein